MMKKNKKEPKTKFILSILLSFIIGIAIGISIYYYNFSDKNKMSLYEGLSIMANLFVVLTAFIAIFFTKKSLETQKEHWLNESFIKHEADILIELRKKIDEANFAINFFLQNLLSVDKKYGFITDTPPIIKYDELKKHFNTLVDLNNFYNSYQNIFRKHQLEKKIECISLLLESARNLPSRDIKYTLIESKDNHQTYRMEQRILAQLLSFNSLAQALHDIKPNKQEKIDNMDNYYQDKINELNHLKNLTSTELTSLIFELDKLTTYVDSNYPESLKKRSMRFFQKK
jgi:hypothetical protein